MSPHILHTFTKIAIESDALVPVTLFCGGCVITGQITDPNRMEEWTLVAVGDAMGTRRSMEGLVDELRLIRAVGADARSTQEPDGLDDEPVYHSICLANAVVRMDGDEYERPFLLVNVGLVIAYTMGILPND